MPGVEYALVLASDGSAAGLLGAPGAASLLLLALASSLFYLYLCSVNSYWGRLRVPHPRPELLFGNARRLLFIQEGLSTTLGRLYHQLHGHAFGGFYMGLTPAIILRDPELIRRVLVTDYFHFYDRGNTMRTPADQLSTHLWTLTGALWKDMRLRLSESFSLSQTRRTFFLVQECCARLQRHLEAATNGQPCRQVELKDLLSSFSADVIGMCAFGIDCGAIDDCKSPFLHFGSKVVEKSSKDALRKMSHLVLPKLATFLRIKLFSPEVSEFFDGILAEIMDHRKKSGMLRDDIIHVLMDLKEKGLEMEENGEKKGITDKFLVAHTLMVFTLGYEMTSSVMSFCLHEMALNPSIQNRARLEVDKVLSRHDGELTYEALQEMTYLDMVVKETLRIYPPMSFIVRSCTEPYELPNSGGVVLPRGTNVYVPLLSLHRDARYFPEPLRFMPERFQDQASSAAFLPFGAGHRSCLGQHFALVEVKAGLAALLSRFEFLSSPRSANSPAPNDHRKCILVPEGGLWTTVRKRTWLSVS